MTQYKHFNNDIIDNRYIFGSYYLTNTNTEYDYHKLAAVMFFVKF